MSIAVVKRYVIMLGGCVDYKISRGNGDSGFAGKTGNVVRVFPYRCGYGQEFCGFLYIGYEFFVVMAPGSVPKLKENYLINTEPLAKVYLSRVTNGWPSGSRRNRERAYPKVCALLLRREDAVNPS